MAVCKRRHKVQSSRKAKLLQQLFPKPMSQETDTILASKLLEHLKTILSLLEGNDHCLEY